MYNSNSYRRNRNYDRYDDHYDDRYYYSRQQHEPRKFQVGDKVVIISTPTKNTAVVINLGKEQYECRLPDNRAIYFYEWELERFDKYMSENGNNSDKISENKH